MGASNSHDEPSAARASRKPGPSDDYLALLRGESTSEVYVEKMKAEVDARFNRYGGPPISTRSMGWAERKLRLFAGSGWNGEHPTGYGWARVLLAVGERLWWK